jgi:hypothetical protein
VTSCSYWWLSSGSHRSCISRSRSHATMSAVEDRERFGSTSASRSTTTVVPLRRHRPQLTQRVPVNR